MCSLYGGYILNFSGRKGSPKLKKCPKVTSFFCNCTPFRPPPAPRADHIRPFPTSRKMVGTGRKWSEWSDWSETVGKGRKFEKSDKKFVFELKLVLTAFLGTILHCLMIVTVRECLFLTQTWSLMTCFVRLRQFFQFFRESQGMVDCQSQYYNVIRLNFFIWKTSKHYKHRPFTFSRVLSIGG